MRNDFTRRIDRWNEKDGLKYGAVEIVGSLDEADVLLVVLSSRLDPREMPPPAMSERAGVPGVPRYPIELVPCLISL